MSRLHPLFETPLPHGWQLTTVDDIKATERSSCVAGPFGSNISSKYFVASGVPVIRGGNLRDDLTRFVADEFVFVSEQQATNYKAQHVRAGDLVFTCWGTIGQVGLIPKDGPFEEYIISNKQLKLRPSLTVSDPEYLFYYFAGPKMVQHVLSKAIGAAVPGINLGILKELPVVLPPLPIQRRIAGVLSAYDQLAENSLRRIKALDATARAIYREWFVNFRCPGHNQHQRRSSDRGEIPHGWSVVKLGDIAEELRRNVPKGELDDPTPYVGLEHIPRRSLALDAWETATELGSNKLAFKRGEVLFGKIRPYFHKVSVAPFDGVCSADTIVIRARRPEHYAIVVACVSSDPFVAEASATANGAKMPRANWDVLSKFPVAIPTGKAAEMFSSLVSNILEEQRTLVFQAHNLRRTRDLLLPRLLSGQIEVKAA
jgi:type I restriction enzyme S subunit